MSGFACLLLRTNTAAQRAAKLLAHADITARLVPVPPELGTACGLALRVTGGDCEPARRVLEAAGLDVAAVHREGPTAARCRPK